MYELIVISDHITFNNNVSLSISHHLFCTEYRNLSCKKILTVGLRARTKRNWHFRAKRKRRPRSCSVIGWERWQWGSKESHHGHLFIITR